MERLLLWRPLALYRGVRGPAPGPVARRARPLPGADEVVVRNPFRDYFERLLSLSPYFNRRIGMRVGFDITGPGGGAWAVDFRPGSERVYSELDGCAYRYSFASRWARPLIDGDLPWEDFFLSLRFRASRDPDLYNDHLLGLLKHANRESLDAVERFEASLDVQERILVRADGPPTVASDIARTPETICWRAGMYCPAGSCAVSHTITSSRWRPESASTGRADRWRSNVSIDRGVGPPAVSGAAKASDHTWDTAAAPRLTRRRFALHGGTTGGLALPDHLATAKNAGFDAVEIGDDELTAYVALGGTLADVRTTLTVSR